MASTDTPVTTPLCIFAQVLLGWAATQDDVRHGVHPDGSEREFAAFTCGAAGQQHDFAAVFDRLGESTVGYQRELAAKMQQLDTGTVAQLVDSAADAFAQQEGETPSAGRRFGRLLAEAISAKEKAAALPDVPDAVPMPPRAYQKEVVDKVRPDQNAIIISGTGTGKTLM